MTQNEYDLAAKLVPAFEGATVREFVDALSEGKAKLPPARK